MHGNQVMTLLYGNEFKNNNMNIAQINIFIFCNAILENIKMRKLCLPEDLYAG